MYLSIQSIPKYTFFNEKQFIIITIIRNKIFYCTLFLKLLELLLYLIDLTYVVYFSNIGYFKNITNLIEKIYKFKIS